LDSVEVALGDETRRERDRDQLFPARPRGPVGVRDKQTTIRSEDVVGVIDEDNAVWSLAHTSIRYENFASAGHLLQISLRDQSG
jgi:hypothetical protein